MKYAIETLRIELYRLKNLMRIVETNEHEARTPLGSNEVQEQIKELEKAIRILEEADE